MIVVVILAGGEYLGTNVTLVVVVTVFAVGSLFTADITAVITVVVSAFGSYAATEIAEIGTAIGNHDEGTGVPVSPLAAALILADKSDVRRSRVRNVDLSTFDIHDRVNYSAVSSSLCIDPQEKTVTLELQIDTAISSVMDYFEIFLERMLLCKRAAGRLGMSFGLVINGETVA